MAEKIRKNGFSLTEVLMAVGILSIGMLFIAGTFPVALYFSTVSTDRTIAASVADEAFAKVQLYASLNPVAFSAIPPLPLIPPPYSTDFNDIARLTIPPLPFYIDPSEYTYPSVSTIEYDYKQYVWSAICRKLDVNPLSTSRDVQVTVFVCRKMVGSHQYRMRLPLPSNNLVTTFAPVPVRVQVERPAAYAYDEFRIIDLNPSLEVTFINDGCAIVDDQTGQIFRVLERYAQQTERVKLDRIFLSNLPGGIAPRYIWVIPPPVAGGRYPCIAVYQKVIRI